MCSAQKASAVNAASSPATAALLGHCERREAISSYRHLFTRRDCFLATLPAMAAGAWQSCRGGPQARHALALLPGGVEIRRIEPSARTMGEQVRARRDGPAQ